MDKYQKRLNNLLKKHKISEANLRMVLGLVIILVIGILAYNIFKGQQVSPNIPGQPPTEEQQGGSKSGGLTAPTAAVALPTEHTVKAGENLWGIAEKYYTSGYNWVDIAKVNNLSDPNEINDGQKLTIPKVEIRQPTVSNSQITTVITESKITGKTYTVIHGDNLWDIAVRAYGDGFKWTEIAKVNQLADPQIIHAGNVLSIPR